MRWMTWRVISARPLFEGIREEIEAETDRGIGNNKGVSDQQIRLKICSPHVLTMTLVDLPGITRVPVGDQPPDIEHQIREMILSYVKRDSCLILAVSPANSDLANSDALMMSRLVDPDGRRTIGVITKLDIMDRGTDACTYLRGEVVPLRLGYIGVINRCQQDIVQRRSIRDSRAAESEFFRLHPAYGQVAAHCGTEALGRTVSTILARHIANLLPSLQDKIVNRRNEAARELAALGDGRPEDPARQAALVLEKLHGYSAAFCNSVTGRSADLSTTALEGGARIHFVLQDIFVKGLQSLDPTEAMSEEDIRTAIQNAAGTKAVLLLPEEPFEVLVKQAIKKMTEPCQKCARIVHDELGRIARGLVAGQDVARYPRLSQAIEDATRDFLTEGLVPAEAMIGSLVDCQLAHINTSHPDFVGGSTALKMAQQELDARHGGGGGGGALADVAGSPPPSGAAAAAGGGENSEDMAVRSGRGGRSGPRPVLAETNGVGGMERSEKIERSPVAAAAKTATPKKSPLARMGSLNKESALFSHENGVVALKDPPLKLAASEAVTEQEQLQVLVTRILLGSYFSISRSVLADTVPKAVMHFLVNSVARGLQQHLIQHLYHPSLVPALLQEHPEAEAMRQARGHTVSVLATSSTTWCTDARHVIHHMV